MISKFILLLMFSGAIIVLSPLLPTDIKSWIASEDNIVVDMKDSIFNRDSPVVIDEGLIDSVKDKVDMEQVFGIGAFILFVLVGSFTIFRRRNKGSRVSYQRYEEESEPDSQPSPFGRPRRAPINFNSTSRGRERKKKLRIHPVTGKKDYV